MTNDATPDEREELAEGTLLSHLVELRSRLVKMGAAIVIVFAALLPFSKKIFAIVAEPIIRTLESGEMIATNPLSVIFTPFKITFIVAIAIAMPIVLYQVWSFVAPGLYRKEKRFAFPLLASSILLFYAGIAFAYFVLFPLVFNFLVAFAPDIVEIMPDIATYASFVVMISFVFGLAFEVPVATVLIVWAGITTPDKLAKARPYVFLMAFVVGMFLTPPDVISQTLLAVPVYLLYELGIFMSKMFAPRRGEAEDEAVAADN
ncbi:MAG: twin-arginine translocase subunit TatC [Woeseiaceae bacterium]|nr:twin-arginine translocase subunit TatC [Woeseiaceae bacterium]